nr:reverse transcriptase domain-containing protein [Tanacetum cinerariifolium]
SVVHRNYDPKGAMFLIAARFPTPPLTYEFVNPGVTETLVPAKSNSYCQAFIVKSLYGVIDGPKKSQVKLKGQIKQKASPAIVEPLYIENLFLEDQFQEDPPKDPPEVSMTNNRTMAEMLRAPTEGWQFIRKKNSRGYVSAAAVQYNQGNPGYRPSGMANQTRPLGFAQPNLQNNQNRFIPPQGFNHGNNFNPEHSYQAPAQQHQNVHLNKLEKVRRMNEANMKAMQTQIDMVKKELRNEMKNSVQTSLINQTNEIKNMMASLLQINTTSTSGSGSLTSNTVANPKGELKAITTRSGLVIDGPTVPTPPTSINSKVDECVEETFTDPDLAEYTIKVPPPPYQKMLKALLSNKEKLQELANTPLNENCSAVILKKLPEKPEDPGKFLIPCGFSELKCKALADLGASINLMPLSVWKKLGLPELISTRMTLELANRVICTPTGIVRDVFVLVGKFTFPADFVIVDYESDPRVPLILGRPFLRTARALIDVHGEEMILRDGDERLTLNMKHNTASYSNHPHRESTNLINSFNVSSEHFLEFSVLNHQSGNPALSLHQESTSPEITHEIHDSEGCNLLSQIFPDIDAFNNIHPHFDDDPLSEIEFLLYQGKYSSIKDSSIQTDRANLNDYFVDPLTEMFTKEHAPDYSSPLKFDVYLDDFLENESYANNFYDDPFDFEGEKIKESKLLMNELDLPCNSLPYLETDSFNSQDFSRVDDLPSPDNEDKVFNPGILIHEKSVTIITHVSQEKKLVISYASLVFKDFEPPFRAPLFFKNVPKSRMLLPFSTENKKKVFKPGIHTSGKDYSDCEISQFVIHKSFTSSASFWESIVQYSQKFEDSCQRILSSKSSFPQLQLGITYPNLID